MDFSKHYVAPSWSSSAASIVRIYILGYDVLHTGTSGSCSCTLLLDHGCGLYLDLNFSDALDLSCRCSAPSDLFSSRTS